MNTADSDRLSEAGRATVEATTLAEVVVAWTVDTHAGSVALTDGARVTRSFTAGTTQGTFEDVDDREDTTTILATW